LWIESATLDERLALPRRATLCRRQGVQASTRPSLDRPTVTELIEQLAETFQPRSVADRGGMLVFRHQLVGVLCGAPKSTTANASATRTPPAYSDGRTEA
jgi:hypothetical protein